MRRLFLGLAVVSMLIGMSTEVRADDQQIADRIIKGLQTAKEQGKLKGFQVDLKVKEGTVWFTGHVSNAEQEKTVFQIAQTCQELGLKKIVDGIEVRTAVVSQPAPVVSAPAAVVQTAYVPQEAKAAPSVVTPAPMQNAGAAPMQAAPMQAAPMQGAPMHMQGQPMPMGGMRGPAMSDHPNMPRYAWPAYAAYPNYAGVTYPGQYSASAWPYIGPFHPYPQVPLGWRKVQLEWNDGWWQLDFRAR